MSRRRSSITVDRPPAYSTNQSGQSLMDTSDSLPSTTIERPSTRSFIKTQNVQRANNVQVNSQAALSSDLKGFANPFSNNSVQIKVVKKQPPPQTYQKILTSQKSNNLINILENSMLKGRRPHSIINVTFRFLLLLTYKTFF